MRFARTVLVGATVVVGLAAISGTADARHRRGRVLVPRTGYGFTYVAPAPCPVYAPAPVYYRAPRVVVYNDRYHDDGYRRRSDGGDWMGRSRRRVERYLFADPYPSAGIGASISSWEPEDPNHSDALLRGHARAYLTPNAAIQGEIGYWRHTTEDALTGDATELRDIPAGASLLLFFRPSSGGFGFRRNSMGLAIYGGLGVDWHTWKEEVTNAADPSLDVSDEDTGFGYHYVAGLEVGPRRGANLFGEFRYNVGDLEDLNGRKFDFTGPSFGGGIAVNF